VETTPRLPPPMITGLSASEGSSRFSTAAKNASQSIWAMVSVSRSGCISPRGEPQRVQRGVAAPAGSPIHRQSRQMKRG
jgi:hypothetical protein